VKYETYAAKSEEPIPVSVVAIYDEMVALMFQENPTAIFSAAESLQKALREAQGE
jgi:hypothetical protein